MALLEPVTVQCPCCWEMIEVVVDASEAGEQYVEDCSVCCRPLVLTTGMDENGALTVVAEAEQD